jgi:hypothetical protein
VNNPGIGASAENDYSYAGGLQYLPSNVYDRKFAGFASTTNSNSDGSIVTYYSQGATSTALVSGDQVDGYAQLNHPFRTDVLTPSGTPRYRRHSSSGMLSRMGIANLLVSRVGLSKTMQAMGPIKIKKAETTPSATIGLRSTGTADRGLKPIGRSEASRQ